MFEGANLVTVAKGAPAGTTFCIHAGTYTIGAPVPVEAGDRFIGEGRDSVFVTTTVARQVFRGTPAPGAVLEGMDISGAQASSSCKVQCGRGIFISGESVTLRNLYVHHNENTGVGGMGRGGLIESSELAFNGSSWLVGCCAGGVKAAAQLTVANSYAHHNIGSGVWLDVCGTGLVVQNSTLEWNTRSGVRYEHSRDCPGLATITGNVIRNNNTSNHNDSAGVRVNSAPNADIGFNTFGGNLRAGVSVGGTRGPVTGTVIHDNVMNGDAVRGCTLTGVTCFNNV
ncbi:MAG TPA: right-handed parallel beta-helix repeat-containing protein [Vicinamibacterales bacterium]|nr:right-handed parallel beta-helix repeat-containing protein [Vicinamibacterales bacterium]